MKKNALVFFVALCLFSTTILSAQTFRGCGNTPEWEAEHSVINLSERKQAFDSTILESIKQTDRITQRSAAVIPVVVHILWTKPEENIDDARIWSQIERLNTDFNAENLDIANVPDEFKPFIGNPGIRFCLAAEDPEGRPSNGIVRVHTDIPGIAFKWDQLFYSDKGGSEAWDPERYLNIWVGDNTPEPGASTAIGYAFFPWNETPEQSGVIISLSAFGKNNSENWNMGRVGVHELGHYFGLRHIWGDANTPDCNDDDGISDTPAQYFYHYGCPEYPQQSCGNSNMFMNYMDYVDDPCMVMFSKEQCQWMNTVLALYRPGLLNSTVQCVQKSEQTLNIPFTIFPNPASRQIHLNFPDSVAEPGEIVIYNYLGHTVFRKFFILRSGIEIDLPQLAAGMYFVKIGKSIEKLVLHP